jgi:hypothetical protein
MTMQSPKSKVRLVLDGERVLLPFSFGVLVLSSLFLISVILHWPEFVRTFTLMALFFSPALLVVACLELWHYQRRWRTVLALFISLLATITAWGTVYLRVTGRV